jgi:uncharacterized membrane protein SirB2
VLARFYLEIRTLHVAAVAASIASFAFRGGLMLARSRWLESRFLRVAPHVIDTVLLASAVSLTLIIQQYPFVNGWLTAKLLALVIYIVLGSIAIRRGRTRGVRIAALAAALLTVGYIVGTALHHDPAPWHWLARAG